MNNYFGQPSTFSIVAFDAKTGDLGIAVQSKFLAVGAVVPWAKAGVGAVATQSYANTSYGPHGLALLAQGISAEDTLNRLTQDDDEHDLRQVGIISAEGDACSFTGKDCHEWAGGLVGRHYCCQGNILVSARTVEAMATTFEDTTGSLAERLLAALAAGQAAGGDKRGQQSGSLLVVRENGGYGGFNDSYINLRVDDHPTPIEELARLHQLHQLYFETSPEADLISITPALAREIQTILTKLNIYKGETNGDYDEETQQALKNYAGIENLEMRWRDEARIDPKVLEYLRNA